MDINYDDVRYGRDWRYGTLQAPYEEVGSLERVYWLAFPTSKDRAKYAADLKFRGDHMDFLSEREIAHAIGVESREALWEYFGLTDPEMAASLVMDGWLGIYGKADPMEKAPAKGQAAK